MAKKSLKTHILEVQGRSRSSMLVPPESSPAVLVMIRSKSVSIGNHSRARLVDSSRNRTFLRGYPNLMRSYGALLEPRGWKLALLKSTFNAENFIRRLSCDCGAVHSWNVSGSLKSQKITKNPYFWGSESLKVMDVCATESSSAVLVVISSKSVSICNHCRAKLVDSSRNRTFSRGYPNLMHTYGWLLEPRGSKLTPLKSTFNVDYLQVVLVYHQ